MSVKNSEWVLRYTTSLDRIRRSLQSMEAMLQKLPAPDDDGNLSTLHYGHVGSVIEVAKQLEELVDAMDYVTTTR